MKRTKQWWSYLTPMERSELMSLERTHSRFTPYYPDDMVECGGCGGPSMGGLCSLCAQRHNQIIAKADAGPAYIPEMDPAVGTNLEAHGHSIEG